jgi:DNA polymerase-3 subunit alpha
VIKFKDIISPKKDQKVLVAGLVISIRSLQTKNGDRMAVVMLDDRFDRFEVTVFPEPYQKFRDLLIKDQLLIIDAFAGNDNFSQGLRIRAQSIYTLGIARESFAKKVNIRLGSDVSSEFIAQLKECLSLQERGACAVYIEYQNESAKAKIKLDDKWNIKPSDDSLTKIHQVVKGIVEVDYS